MNARRRLALVSVAAAALAALLWRWASPAGGGPEAGAPAGGAHATLAPADAAAAGRIVAQAQVVPIDGIIEVRPLADGRVLRVFVHPGDRVRERQVLAEIERDRQSAQVRQRRADLSAASERLRLASQGPRPEEQAALAAAASAADEELELAHDRWQRQRQLLARHFVSDQAVTAAEHEWRAAEARAHEAHSRLQAAQAGGRPEEVAEARAAVDAADAAVAEQSVALERTRILAPVGGVIMTRNVNPGDIIGSDVTSPTLFRIVDPTRLEIRFEVEELLAPKLRVGQAVEFTLPGRPQVIAKGHVIRIAPQVEKRSIGADDARIRADSLVRPAWADFIPETASEPLPVNFRLEARIAAGAS